jgi:hypothetical protein
MPLLTLGQRQPQGQLAILADVTINEGPQP